MLSAQRPSAPPKWEELRLQSEAMRLMSGFRGPETVAALVFSEFDAVHKVHGWPTPVMEIAEWLGVEVCEAEGNPPWSGALQSEEHRERPLVWFRPSDTRNHQRFTVAHELGHLMMHRRKEWVDVTFFRSGPDSRFEPEANSFAAALLMPYSRVKHAVSQYGYAIRPLARRFEVSEGAMKFRLMNMGIYG